MRLWVRWLGERPQSALAHTAIVLAVVRGRGLAFGTRVPKAGLEHPPADRYTCYRPLRKVDLAEMVCFLKRFLALSTLWCIFLSPPLALPGGLISYKMCILCVFSP